MCACSALVSAARPQPLRPALPPLLQLALGLWAAAAWAFSEGRGACVERDVLVLAAALFATVAAIALLLRGRCRLRPVAWMALGIGLGLMLGTIGAAQMRASADELSDSVRSCSVELLGDASEGSYGYSAPARATVEGRSVKVRLTGLEEPLYCGQRLEGAFSFAAPSEEAASFYWQNGFALRIAAKDFRLQEVPFPRGALMALRQKAVEGLKASGAPGAPLLAALACGYRPGIVADGSYDQFKWSGTAHLVAVSGAHLALVVFVLEALAKCTGLGRKGRTAALCLLVAAYVAFSGMPVSALRSAFMVVSALFGALAKRRGASLNALALCIALFVAVEPACALSVSFALSAGSTLGILLFSGKVASWFWFVPERFSEVLVAPVALTLSSQLATLPLGCALFSQLSLVALPCNVLAAPLFAPAVLCALASACLVAISPALGPVCCCALFSQLSLVALPCNVLAAPLFAPAVLCALASACLVAISPALGPVCWAASLTSAPLRWVVALFSSIPGACVSVEVPVVPALAASVVLMALLYWRWKRATGAAALLSALGAGVALLVTLAMAPLLSAPQLVMLDVGQGDALAVTSRGRAVLVDAGEEDEMLLSALARHNIRHLDAVVVTHSDKDHYGSLPALHPYVTVDAVYAYEGIRSCECENCDQFRMAVGQLGCDLRGLSAGDVMQVGEVRLAVAGPERLSDKGGNDDSLCIVGTVAANGRAPWTFLLTGDAEQEPVGRAVRAARLGAIDVVKVGHHGSQGALSPQLLEALSPSVALISVGEDNSYGHPHASTLQLLEQASVPVFRTDLSGDVTASFAPSGIEVRVQREGGPE